MMYDFVVIGAGMAGASIAYELALSGRVCVIEGEATPGLHATGRSAALFAPSYGGREIRILTRASRSFFNSPPQGCFGEHPLLQERGCLYIARSDQHARLGQMTTSIVASGGSAELLDARNAIARVPLLRESYIAEAVSESDVLDIDVDALHQGFLRGARAASAMLVTNSLVAAPQRRAGVWSIELRDGPVRAPVLVNAAGAWADEVAASCGAARLGLQPLRRTAALVDVPAGLDIRDWPAVVDVDEMFYFKPQAGKLLLSPADETPDVPGDVMPDDLDVATGVDRVQAVLDLEVRRVSHRWAGLRTFSPDRVPVAGFDPRVEGLFWCAGQGGYGIQTAPALARTAAALARREELPRDISSAGLAAADLSPLRFARAAAAG